MDRQQRDKIQETEWLCSTQTILYTIDDGTLPIKPYRQRAMEERRNEQLVWAWDFCRCEINKRPKKREK